MLSKFVGGFGALQTNSPQHVGKPWYVPSLKETSHAELRARMSQPTSIPKNEAEWILASSYQSRSRDEQMLAGEFSMLWVDMDELDSMYDMKTIRTYIEDMIAPEQECFIYTSSSWTAKKPKYRAIFLLDETLSYEDWHQAQRGLFGMFADVGIELDPVSTRVQQPCYLPNVDPSSGDIANYQFEIIEGARDIEWVRESMVKVAAADTLSEAAADAKRLQKALLGNDDTKPKEVKLFNKVTDLETLMLSVGYISRSNRPDSNGHMHYQSPNQSGSSYATMVYPGGDRWSSRSSSDIDAELGNVSATGEDAYGDASDIATFFKFNNNAAKFRQWVRENVPNDDGLTMVQIEAGKMIEAALQHEENVTTLAAPISQDVDVCLPEELHSVPIMSGLVNQQSIDALTILTSTFKNRIALIEGEMHWWTGTHWTVADDSWLGRHVSVALDGCDKENTLARTKNLTGVIKLRCNHFNESNPVSELVFFKNGVYDLTCNEIRPHCADDLNTSVLSVNYTPDGVGVYWLDWLADIFASDPVRIDLLQEVMGWSLISSNLNIQKAILFNGVQRAGKGVIMQLLGEVLGASATSFNLNTLHNTKGLNSCLRANIAIDADAVGPSSRDAKEVQAMFKKVTANDKVSVQQLYVNASKNVKLNCKLYALSNSIPSMFDDSGATNSRWVPLSFDKSFHNSEDRGLADRMRCDLEFIANWALVGLIRLKKNGKFTVPTTSGEVIEKMAISGTPVKLFINDSLSVEDGGRLSSLQVWTAYVWWCNENGEEEPSTRRRAQFYTSIETVLMSQGVKFSNSVRINGKVTRGFTGLKLKDRTPVVLESVK